MLGWEGELPRPDVLTIEEMRAVLADPSCEGSGSLYYTYRDMAKSDADWSWLRHHNLRYDLTVIPSRALCGEWVKTKGHYHPKNPAGIGYPEICEVMEGEAHYLLQSRTLDDVVMISASAGDVVIIPPDYGHIAINPLPDTTLVLGTIVSTAFQSEYGEYKKNQGAAYYEMSSGTMKRNPSYPFLPPIRYLGASCGKGKHRICKAPLYDLIGNEDALLFLNFPEKFLTVFSVLLKG